MKKTITSLLILTAFLCTSCKSEPISIKPDSDSISEQIIDQENQKYFNAENLNLNPLEVIGIKNNFIYSNSMEFTGKSIFSFEETGIFPDFNHELNFTSQVIHSGDKLYLYGRDENQSYFLEKYDSETNSFYTVLDCSSMPECNYKYFSNITVSESGKIFAYYENADNTYSIYSFGESGNILTNSDVSGLEGFNRSSWFVYDIHSSNDGTLYMLANNGEANLIYIFDDSLNQINTIMLTDFTFPYKLFDVNGVPVIADSDTETGDVCFYSVDIVSGETKFLNSLSKPDAVLNSYENEKIAFIKNNLIHSFDINTSDTNTLFENEVPDAAYVFSLNGSLFYTINEVKASITIHKKTSDNSESNIEYSLLDENIEMAYWERILPSEKIQLIADDGKNDSAYTFYCIDMEKTDIEKVTIPYDEGYIKQALISGEYRIYDHIDNTENETIKIYNSNGTFVSDIEIKNQEINDIVSVSDGRIILHLSDKASNSEISVLKLINPANPLHDSNQLSIDSFGECRIFSGNETYDAFLATADNVLGIDFDNNSVIQLINFDNTSLPKDIEIFNLWYENEETFYLATSDTVFKLSASEKQPEQSSRILDIGCFNFRPEDFIISYFEKKYPEYKVSLTDYSTDTPDFQNEFDRALLSDTAPDLIYFSSDDYYDPTRHNRKSAYTDMYKLMAEDLEFSKSDLLENVLDALEYDGSLYQITPRFELYTILTDSDELTVKKSWTTEEFVDYYYNHQDSAFPDPSMSVEFIASYLNPFVDYKNKEISFEGNSFMELAKLNHIFADGDFRNYDGFTMLDTYLYDFNVFNNTENAIFHGNHTSNIGFPGIKGNGALIIPDGEFSILSSSDNTEGAWRFIKCFFTEEYQDNSSQIKFPVNKNLLKKMKEQTKYVPSAEEDGYIYSTNLNGYDFNHNSVELPVPDDEILGRTMEIIQGSREIFKKDPAIDNIYFDEFIKYYNEEVSAEEMCSAIAGRVQIYLDEEY